MKKLFGKGFKVILILALTLVLCPVIDTRAEEDTEQEENPGDGDGTEAGGNAPGTGQDGSQPDGSGEDRDQPDSPGQDGGNNGGNGADTDHGSLRDNPTGG